MARVDLALAATLCGSFQIGYHLAILNATLQAMAEKLGFSSHAYSGVVTSALLVGSLASSFSHHLWNGTWGPRNLLMAAAFPLIFGCLGNCLAHDVWSILAGRFVAGIGVGIVAIVAPQYISEITPSHRRGQLGSLHPTFIAIGVFAALLAAAPYDIKSRGAWADGWWRWLFFLGSFPAMAQFLLLWFFSRESPEWLMSKARHAEALDSIVAFGMEDDIFIGGSSHVSRIEEALLAEEHRGQDLWSFFTRAEYRRMMLLTLYMPVNTMWCGINSLTFYSTAFLETLKAPLPISSSAGILSFQIVSMIFASRLIDRSGRKILMVISHAGMGLNLTVVCLLQFIPGLPSFASYFVLGNLVSFMLFYGIGAGPVCWVYVTEILPLSLRSTVLPICIAIMTAANILVGLTFPVLLSHYGVAGALSPYVIWNTLSVFICGFGMIETKGEHKENIAESFLM